MNWYSEKAQNFCRRRDEGGRFEGEHGTSWDFYAPATANAYHAMCLDNAVTTHY